MTNKTKNILLLVGFFLSLIACYQLAISKTITLKRELSLLKQQETFFGDTSKKISLLKQKEKYYDGLLSKYQLNGSSIQNSLLKTINTFADSTHIQVVSFLEPHIVFQNELKISTYLFTLEGDFNSILKLIHSLEQDTKFGEIVNLHFEKKTNFKTGTFYLQAHVLLKSFG